MTDDEAWEQMRHAAVIQIDGVILRDKGRPVRPFELKPGRYYTYDRQTGEIEWGTTTGIASH